MTRGYALLLTTPGGNVQLLGEIFDTWHDANVFVHLTASQPELLTIVEILHHD